MALVTGAGPFSMFLLLLPPPKPPPLFISPNPKFKKQCLRPRTRWSHAVFPRVFCPSRVVSKTFHSRTVKIFSATFGNDTLVATTVEAPCVYSFSPASLSNLLPSSSGFPDLASLVSSLDPPEPPDPPDPSAAPSFGVYSSSAFSALILSPNPDLLRSLVRCRSGLCFGSFTSSAFLRLITALCRKLPKFCYRFRSGYCFGYPVQFWCFTFLLSPLLGVMTFGSSLYLRMVRRLQRNSNSILGIFTSRSAMVSAKVSILCRPWLRLGTLCHCYSLVEMFGRSYPLLWWIVCVAGTQVFSRVTILAYLSLYDMVSWFRNALGVSLLYGSLRRQLVTLALLVEGNVQKCLWESLPSLPIELYGFEGEGVWRLIALVSVFVVSNFSCVWGYVASTSEAVFQVTISFSLGVSAPLFASSNLLTLSNDTISLYNNSNIETGGHLFVFNCESVMFVFIFHFSVSHLACFAMVNLAGLALLSSFVNTYSMAGD